MVCYTIFSLGALPGVGAEGTQCPVQIHVYAQSPTNIVPTNIA